MRIIDMEVLLTIEMLAYVMAHAIDFSHVIVSCASDLKFIELFAILNEAFSMFRAMHKSQDNWILQT